jgi:hypothetical protein
MRPLAIDLYCGLGGWSEGLLAEGYDVVGFDIERHQYGEHRYPAQLVIQDVTTLHGSQFKNAALIVASPPCQEYSYMAMPWKRAKAKATAIRADTTGAELARLNRLFNACLRIQREACEAAGRHIPLIIENVKGAQPWVGRARWSFGSFYLWGDVPALMPVTVGRLKLKGGDVGWRERGPGRQLQDHATKNNGGSWFNIAHNTTSGKGQNPDGRMDRRATALVASEVSVQELPRADGQACDGLPEISLTGRKHDGSGWRENGTLVLNNRMVASGIKNSTGRKFASAMIAKIPLPLSRHIAATFRP